MRKVLCIPFAILASASGLTSTTASAMNWTFSKGLGVSSSYSDNISFTTEELAETGFIDRLSPRFTWEGVGNRSNILLSAGGEYQGVFRSGVKEASFVPRVTGNASTEIVPNFFFLRADASVSEISSSAESVFDDPLLNPDDSITQTSYSINPYIDYTLNETDQFRVDYAFGEAFSNDSMSTDTRSQRSQISWQHLPQSGAYGWNLDAEYQNSENPDENQSAELYSASAEFGYLLSPEWLLTVGAGNDWIQLPEQVSTTKFDTWQLQLDWRPNARTSMEIGYGESSVGKAPFFAYTLRGRRSTLEARWQRGYARQLTRPGLSDEQQLLTALGLSDLSAAEIVSNNVQFEQLLFDGQFSIDESVSLRYSLTGRVSDIVLNTTYLVRENQQTDSETENLLMGASFNRRLNRIADFTVQYLYREQLPDTANAALFENRLTLSFNFTL